MSDGDKLIFLISQPRAGSTLLQKVLGAHSDIHTVSEPWIALHPLLAMRRHGVSGVHSHCLAQQATAGFLAGIPGGEDTYFQAVRLMLDRLYDAVRLPSGKPLFLDKTPRYYFIIRELRRIYPEARFVFLIRNPLAVFASILEEWVKQPYFSGRYALRIDLLHDLLTAPGVLADAVMSPSQNDAVIHYENFVQAPASSLSRLCLRLRISCQPEMIDYGDKSNPRFAFGDQSIVYSETRPVTARAERWQKVLQPGTPWNELAQSYLRALGPALVERLGYDYAGLKAGLAVPGGSSKEPPPFLGTAVLTPAYGETCDYVSQSAYFQDLIERFGAMRRPVNKEVSVV